MISTRAMVVAVCRDVRFRTSFVPLVGRLARPAATAEEAERRSKIAQAGQVIVLFALMMTMLIGLVGLAVDVTWAWRNALQAQRAADAASLAGVVYLPGNVTQAKQSAKDEAKKNGYVTGGGVTVTADPHAGNDRQLDVSVTTPSPTFFVRLFGVNSFTVSRASSAIYVMPVPMGSPLAYYGVYQLCSTSDTCVSQPSPTAMSVSSQGFFGAIEGEGSNRSTGDAFAPYWNPNPTVNANYSAEGYDYDVEAKSSGTLYMFDPIFCATAKKTSGGGYSGVGDHWLGTPTPVSTYFILWDTNNTPLIKSDDFKVWTKYYTNQNQVDKGTTYGSTTLSNYSDSGAPVSPADCKSDPAHNQWVAGPAVSAGHAYRLQVTTTDPSNPAGNRDETFENMFSLAVSGTGNRIYGEGSMITYANVTSGAQEFYLAQIDRVAGAGKTVVIDLFDPGDVGKAAWLQILPDGHPAWQPATFNYTADSNASPGHRSGTGVTCIQTYGGTGGSPPSGCPNATSGGIFYQNSWIHIEIPLPVTYGDATHPLDNQGWWKIRYTVQDGSDTTTWQVSVRGNPVHLISPAGGAGGG